MSDSSSNSCESRTKAVHQLIDVLIQSNPENQGFLLNTLESLLKAQRDNPDPGDLKLIQVALGELVESCLLFKNYRDTRKVAIFGSARTKPEHPNYTIAEDTARRLAESGMMVITGAGPGIMEAGNKGAGDSGFGLNIELPFENEPNEFIEADSKLLNYRYFFARKLAFIKESDAVALFPGGFGTQDEAFEVLTLIQTGRCAPRPVLLINFDKSNYWSSWRHYVKEQLLDREYISEEDLAIYEEVTSVDELIARIKEFYSTYHSVRYVNKVTSMRLNNPLRTGMLEEINEKFSFLLKSGDFQLKQAADVPGEADIYPEKLRLVFHFDLANYGGLYQLINFINSHCAEVS